MIRKRLNHDLNWLKSNHSCEAAFSHKNNVFITSISHSPHAGTHADIGSGNRHTHCTVEVYAKRWMTHSFCYSRTYHRADTGPTTYPFQVEILVSLKSSWICIYNQTKHWFFYLWFLKPIWRNTSVVLELQKGSIRIYNCIVVSACICGCGG